VDEVDAVLGMVNANGTLYGRIFAANHPRMPVFGRPSG
jgi:hypothetical protein